MSAMSFDNTAGWDAEKRRRLLVVPGRSYTASLTANLAKSSIDLAFFDKDGVLISTQGTGDEPVEVEMREQHMIVRKTVAAAHNPAQNRKQRRAADARDRRTK